MIRLDPPRSVPERPIYFTETVPCGDVLTFRRPHDFTSSRLISLIQEVADDDMDAEANAVLSACVVGSLWFHPEYGIEAVPPVTESVEEWRAYGSAVLVELSEWGFGALSHVMVVAPRLISRIMEWITGKPLEAVAVDFGEQPRG